jgi:glycosyltransferase involved in cell wall biosynthesis
LMVRDHHIPRPLIIPNTCLYEEAAPEPELWRQYAIPEGTPVILYQGYLAEERGLEELLASVPRWNPGPVLVLQGDGVFRGKLEKMAGDLGVLSRVFFTGMVPETELNRYARSCAYGIMPYQASNQNFYNVLPNKFFSYSINRRPVLASNFPQMRLLIGEFGLGATFDPLSPDDIARAVNYSVESGLEIDPENHRRFVAEYSWQATSRKLLEAVRGMGKKQ